MKKYLSPPVQAFFGFVVVLSIGIYGFSDYYLNSLGKEMMLNWAKTEAVPIQEGNLLTSVTKSQPYLASSNYVRGVQLLKITGDHYEARIALGAPFRPQPPSSEKLNGEPLVSRVGFLHSQVFYRIPSERDFVLAFDLESPVLTYAFLASVAILILMLLGLISILRFIDRKESRKREHLLKLAINDLILRGAATDLLDQQFPEIAGWWKQKKKELAEINRVAMENENKIILGEMASRLAHDIKNPLRNIRTLVRRTVGLDDVQTENLNNSVRKIEAIATTISERTKQIVCNEFNKKSIVEIRALVERVLSEKSDIARGIRFKFNTDAPVECYLNSLELERALANLIDNAVDATKPNGSIQIQVARSKSSASISITDSGKGISGTDLKKVGIKGFTAGKSGGTGLGVYYAKRFVEESGGTFSIASQIGRGTTVEITLPLINDSAPIPDQIQLRSGMALVFLDDDPLVLTTVKAKIDPLSLESKGISCKFFQKSKELQDWASNAPADFLVVTDFNLEGETESGLDVIERLRLVSKSWVFTSAPEDERLRTSARRLGVPVLGKDHFFSLPILIKDNERDPIGISELN